MENLERIFSESEGRDDLLLLEDGLDPPYLSRHIESETAPHSPTFLPSHPFSSPSPSPSLPARSSTLVHPHPHPHPSNETLISPSSLAFKFLSLPALPLPSSSSPSSDQNPAFHLQQLIFPNVSALSPSTTSTSSTSTPSSLIAFQPPSLPVLSTVTPTTTGVGGPGPGPGPATGDESLKPQSLEDLYAEAACEVCYKAKRSCDRRVPCGRCVRLSRSHLCIQRVRKTPRPRKIREPRPNGMSFLHKRPSEIQIGSSWIVDSQSNKVPRLAPHHIVQASVIQPQDLKHPPSASPQQSQQQLQQQLPPPPPSPSLASQPMQTSPRHQHSLPSHSSHQHQHSHSHPHINPPTPSAPTTVIAPPLQSIQQLLGIEPIDWLSFFADRETITGTLLPLISLASKLDDQKWRNNQYELQAFLSTHEEKWITTWYDAISTNKDALNKAGFLVKFDRVLSLSLLQMTSGSIQDLLLSMFQTQEREWYKKNVPASPLPPHPPPSSSSSSSSSSTSTLSPTSQSKRIEENSQLTSTSSSTSSSSTNVNVNLTNGGFVATIPLPFVVKGYESSHCDLHATVVIQWSRKEPTDGLPPHVTLELGSNKEMQRLFGYESREVEADPHLFSRLMHPKDWSTLISKTCNAWIKGSTYMAMFATCINKRHIEFPCLLEFRSTIIREEHALRVYCFFIPVPTTP